MTNYYQDLGVESNVTTQEIKAAYRRLALTTHPDKVASKEAQFNRIQEAYEVLGDPTTRRAYDVSQSSLINPASHIERFAHQDLPFYLVSSPEHLDLYSYFNQLFNWQEDKAITPTSLPHHDVQWEMLNYVGYKLLRREERLTRDYRYSSAEVKEELRLIEVNTAKISLLLRIIVASPQHRKRLYDVAMGFDNSAEMAEITRLLGGKTQLARFMKYHPDLTGAKAVFNLYQVGSLTPESFNQLIPNPEFQLSHLSMAINDLIEVNLLTQANFDRLMHQKKYAPIITKGLSRLKIAQLLTQDYFERLVAAGPEAEKVGYYFEAVKKASLLNAETISIISHRTLKGYISTPMLTMRRSGELNEETSQVAIWQGPAEVQELNQRLDQLIAYGIYLLSCDVEKGKCAMLHGLALKKELKDFFKLPNAEQTQELPAFKAAFLIKLHCQDEHMATHREEWKIIVANIAIALTGMGLIALGIQYVATGQCFFASTQRQKLVEQVAQDLWLTPGHYVNQ